MNEQQFYQTMVRPKLQTWGWFYERMENQLSPGAMDINYMTSNGDDGWIETKIIHDNGLIYFEKFQLPWMVRRLLISPNSRIFVLAKMNKPMPAVYLAHASEFVGKRHDAVIQSKWLTFKYSDVKWDSIATSKGDWRNVMKVLEGPIKRGSS